MTTNDGCAIKTPAKQWDAERESKAGGSHESEGPAVAGSDEEAGDERQRGADGCDGNGLDHTGSHDLRAIAKQAASDCP